MDTTSNKSMNDIITRIEVATPRLDHNMSEGDHDLCNDLRFIFRFGDSLKMSYKFCSTIESIKGRRFEPDTLGEKMKDILYKYCHDEDHYFITNDRNLIQYQGLSQSNTCIVHYCKNTDIPYDDLNAAISKYRLVRYMSSDSPITRNNLSKLTYNISSSIEPPSNRHVSENSTWLIFAPVITLFVIVFLIVLIRR